MELHYLTDHRGWWVGHHDLPPTKGDLDAYVKGLNAEGTYLVRIVEDGVVLYGDPASACTECGRAHEGWSGSCLLD
jgi:hypothetical protein